MEQEQEQEQELELELEEDQDQDHVITTVDDDREATCWGCGSRLLLPSYVPIFKCGWCGAITNQTESKYENKYYWWRRARDRSFVCVLLGFMLFVICGGVWSVYPVAFGISYFCGIFNSVITFILSIITLSTFSLAAFRCAGAPPFIEWGSYPAVRKGQLDNYTFCRSCSKPKCPRAHHCRSCEMCVLDMDHHCPFIGNCVGAANHRHFIAFLISAIISMLYLAIMAVYTLMQIWPPVSYRHTDRIKGYGFTWTMLKEIIIATLSSAVFLPARGLLLVYLLFAGVSVNIGLIVLLWQQLQYIYEGKTYLSHLISSEGSSGGEIGEKDCNNLVRFFGCSYSISRYLPCCRDHQKRHNK